METSSDMSWCSHIFVKHIKLQSRYSVQLLANNVMSSIISHDLTFPMMRGGRRDLYLISSINLDPALLLCLFSLTLTYIYNFITVTNILSWNQTTVFPLTLQSSFVSIPNQTTWPKNWPICNVRADTVRPVGGIIMVVITSDNSNLMEILELI